jgi:uroporphyrinogen decarboxylase
MLPAYRKMTDFYRDHGVETILVDCDGDVMGLVPLLIEGGVTGLYPFEVSGRTDAVEVRRAHPRFQILGGIDKKKIAAGREAIDEELERKIPPVFQSGGFVPFTDHTVPPDISWENFCYYRERLAELAES